MRNSLAYRTGYKYQTAKICRIKVDIRPEKEIKTRYISLDLLGNLVIEEGYAWDGCSGPTKDTESNMRAGAVHDALYQLMRMGLLGQEWRKQADKELKRIFTIDGMRVAERSGSIMKSVRKRTVKIRAYYFYKAVRGFGKSSASTDNQKEILIAP